MQIILCHPLIASAKLKPDMVLEDVDSDNEWQQKHEDQSKPAVASLAPPSQTANYQENHHFTDATVRQQPSESVSKMSQEDAETQTGRWTPFIESIKREAEDVALATMEER